MTFTESVRTVLRDKYATFTGRASRSEYWWFILCNILVFIALAILFMISGGGAWAVAMSGEYGAADSMTLGVLPKIILILFLIYYLAIIIPSISVAVRRFHDRNMSGWWMLGFIVLSAIPIVGIVAGIAQIVIMALKGTDGENKFGADPLA